MVGAYVMDRKIRCAIHDRQLVFYRNRWGRAPARGCPVCVKAFRDHVQREQDRLRAQRFSLMDRAHLFEGLTK